MQRAAILYVLLAGFLSCGCESRANDAPRRKSRGEHERIVRHIRSLGGVAEIYDKESLKEEKLPRSFRGCISSIHLNRIDLSDVDLHVLIPYHTVHWVDLEVSNTTDEDIRQLRHCRRLDTLSLDSTNITDESVKHIAEISTLKYLGLDRCQITDRALQYLQKCAALKRLSLIDTHVTREGIDNLKQRLPGVEEVLWSTVRDENVRCALASLEQAGATVGGAIEKRNKSEMRLLPYRYYIHLGKHWKDPQEAIHWLKTVIDSDNTSFGVGPVPTQLFARLGQLERIKKLAMIPKDGVGDSDVHPLTGVGKIEMILLYGSRMTDVGIGYLTKVNGLKELHLKEMTITTPMVSNLAECKMLQKLTFSFCDLDYRRFDAFEQSPSLKELNFDTCKNVSSEAVRDLRARRPELKITLLKDGQPVPDKATNE